MGLKRRTPPRGGVASSSCVLCGEEASLGAAACSVSDSVMRISQDSPLPSVSRTQPTSPNTSGGSQLAKLSLIHGPKSSFAASAHGSRAHSVSVGEGESHDPESVLYATSSSLLKSPRVVPRVMHILEVGICKPKANILPNNQRWFLPSHFDEVVEVQRDGRRAGGRRPRSPDRGLPVICRRLDR